MEKYPNDPELRINCFANKEFRSAGLNTLIKLMAKLEIKFDKSFDFENALVDNYQETIDFNLIINNSSEDPPIATQIEEDKIKFTIELPYGFQTHLAWKKAFKIIESIPSGARYELKLIDVTYNGENWKEEHNAEYSFNFEGKRLND